MLQFPEDLDENPQDRRDFREEWVDIAEQEQIDEGDITVSETVAGKDPLPGTDVGEMDQDVIEEDDLTILDEDDPELGFSYDLEDDYLDEDDEE